MKIYTILARLPWPKSFTGKLLAISFVGMHVPLIVFAAYILSTAPHFDPFLRNLALLMIGATLVGTAATLLLINGLVAPLRYMAAALDDYRRTSAKPSLPTHHRDQLGLLLSSVQTTVEAFDTSLHNMRILADTDPLTGVGNRRWLIDQGEDAFSKAIDSGRPLAVAMIDLDGFKLLNDQHGHLVGDRALREIAIIARGVFGGDTYLGRWGGDEFCVILPNLSNEDVLAMVEVFRVRVEQASITGRRPGTLTASAGIAFCTLEDGTIRRCIERADRQLYKAKAGGKNRWER